MSERLDPALEAVEPRLAWIFGSPRTGSTWLLRMLIHPWRLARNELGFRRHPGPSSALAHPDVLPINESHLPIHLSRFRWVWEMLEPAPEMDGADLPKLLNPERDERASFFFSRQYEETWRPRLRALVLDRFREQAARAQRELAIGDPLILIKEPNGSYAADVTMSLLPRSRLVFLVRDGRDVVDSTLALRQPGGRSVTVRGQRPVSSSEERLAFVRERAMLWVAATQSVQRAAAAHPAELSIQVRYEDLRTQTAEELTRLLEFLGLDHGDDAVQAAVEAERFEAIPADRTGPGRSFRAATPGLWAESLSADEQDAIEEIAGPTLRQLGYE